MPDSRILTRSLGLIGRNGIALLRHTSSVWWLLMETLRWVLHRARRRRLLGDGAILRQMEEIGLRSLPIIALIALLIGVILAMQTFFQMKRLGAESLIGGMVAVALTRELAPLLTALVVAGRVGAAFTAEIGSMKVTEEVLALETIGINPVGFLVAPRFLAMTIMLPALTVFAVVLGIMGGWALGAGNFGMSTGGYFDSARDSLVLKDFVSAGVKSVVFGWIIALMACYRGLIVEGGPEEVGRGTMEAVVSSMVLIVVADFFITGLFYYSFYLFKVPIL
ncbi:MAG: ABC transporter permease [Deltaproteobacteria bacterium]|nr:ABC transporter permease [Deltaproteobacteria bacterium]